MPEVRRLGDGYEPHVDEIDGKLIYGLPVDSSFVSVSFSFEIQQADLDVLLADPYRRAVLEVVAHSVLQRTMVRGRRQLTQADFSDWVARILHTSDADLAATLTAFDRDYNMRVAYYVDQILARRAGDAHG